MARAGFLLSPCLQGAFDVALLAEEGGSAASLAHRDVLAIRVTPDAGAGWLWRRDVRVRLDAIDLPARPLPDTPALRALRSRFEMLRGARQPARLLRTDAGEELVGAHAPSLHVFTPAEGSSRLRLGFGLLDAAWKEGRTDGVEFAAVALVAGGAPARVWARTLRPREVAADRGRQHAEVSLPPSTLGIRLETRPGATTDWDWAYWSEAVAE